MQVLNNIKKKIVDMSGLALTMWQMTNQAFMEHDLDLLSKVLNEENKLNNFEKEITVELITLSRQTLNKSEKSNAVILADVVGDLEIIGDYCKDILERVQTKIEEKLLFSDEAVKEYEDLYHKTEDALNIIVCALERDRLSLVKEVLKNQKHIDSLVGEYRKRHDQRLIEGICSPLACNMFLNMLDFTAQISHHTEAIAKNILKLK
jgi:phosphate:Na+ symporter